MYSDFSEPPRELDIHSARRLRERSYASVAYLMNSSVDGELFVRRRGKRIAIGAGLVSQSQYLKCLCLNTSL